MNSDNVAEIYRGTLNVNTNKPKTITCPECHGLGSLPSGDGFDEPCRECGGSGVVYDETAEDWESNVED